MQQAKNLKGYRREVGAALSNEFLRQAMDKFAVAYRTGRENAFSGLDVDDLVAEVARSKDLAVEKLDLLLAEFKRNAAQVGVTVHEARTAQEANEIIAGIARDNQVQKIIKSKSMTAEETLLNHHLEAVGLEVTETDLGEWIIQLRHEGPSHMVMPAIHLSRYQVADLFGSVTGHQQDSDIERLVKVARRELRQKFVEADMGISGANFAIAESGTIGLITNEGNARLVTTLPRVHVALVGLEKLVPTLNDALKVLKVLPRNATGQAITSYVTWITGANACATAEGGRKQMHIVFLDNGRRALSTDPIFSQVLRCVRCGACKAICAAGIDLPRLIKEVHTKVQDEEGHPIKSLMLAKVLKSRRLFHTLLRSAKMAQKPVTGGTPYLRHLPQIFSKEHNFRALPAIAEKPFRDRWASLRPQVSNPRLRVALFSGCVQDFVYPEQLEAAVTLMAEQRVALEFPMQQSCCGLPVAMMSEKEAARDVARQNVKAINTDAVDYIVTLCASCASHLKHAYPEILADDTELSVRATQFAGKVVPFSFFMQEILDIQPEALRAPRQKVTFHAPCHLCRGLGVTEAPHRLIEQAGFEFVPALEEFTCCGFGGTYSAKFPEISAQILDKKLDDVRETGAEILVTECPGCVMQLRGGAQKRHENFTVMHLAEMLAQGRK